MAKMGTGKLTRQGDSGEAGLKAAGFPQMIPANLIVNPVARAPIATFGVNAFGNPLSRSIMPEGFMTDTGVLPSSNDATGQQPF